MSSLTADGCGLSGVVRPGNRPGESAPGRSVTYLFDLTITA